MDEDPTDEELVARCVASADEQAFRCLLDRHIEKVTCVAALILGVRLASDVDDVVQEVFVRVHRGLKNYRFESKFSTWIFRITYNQSITHKKRGLARLAKLEQQGESEALSREVAPFQSVDGASRRGESTGESTSDSFFASCELLVILEDRSRRGPSPGGSENFGEVPETARTLPNLKKWSQTTFFIKTWFSPSLRRAHLFVPRGHLRL